MNSSLTETLTELAEILEEANSLCRSAHSIADREGSATNWEAFKKRLEEGLIRQHKIMYGQGISY